MKIKMIFYFLYTFLCYLCICFARSMCWFYHFLKEVISISGKECASHDLLVSETGTHWSLVAGLTQFGANSYIPQKPFIIHSVSVLWIVNFLTQCFWHKLVMSGRCHQNLTRLASLPPPFVLRPQEGPVRHSPGLTCRIITFPIQIPARLGSSVTRQMLQALR